MLRNRYINYQLKPKSTDQVFADVYKSNAWRGKNSISGTGSDVCQTRTIVEELPAVFSDIGISTILDIPCGDFHCMKNVDLSDIDYTGADIVNDLIEKNTGQYGRVWCAFPETRPNQRSTAKGRFSLLSRLSRAFIF
jgi:hypothetical protein